MHLAGKRCWDHALAGGLGLGMASLSFSLEGVEIKLQEEGRAVLRGYELFRLSPIHTDNSVPPLPRVTLTGAHSSQSCLGQVQKGLTWSLLHGCHPLS